MSNILEIKDLVKTYANGAQALKGVSFNVKKGEFLVVIGLSGSGKSSLLRCINRIQEPTSGQIHFNHQDIAALRGEQIRSLRKNIAMIFQQFGLVPRFSVLQNVLLGRLGRTGTLKSIFGFFTAEDRAEAQRYLKLVGIEHKIADRTDQLSGGQQQRVAIARALVQQPQILMADEPVASLDPAVSNTVMDYLKKINTEMGITVICNLHLLGLVRQYATRVIALKEGRIVYDGVPHNIDESWFEKIYGQGAREVQTK